MSRAPRITVITVNLNQATGLQATAASIAHQVRAPDEWLVIDGASTDRSLAVIRDYEGLIDRWWSEPDGGVYDAMNRGLRRSRGDYLIFMNAGDRLVDPEVLSWVSAVLAQGPPVDLLVAGTCLETPDGWRRYRPPRSPTAWLGVGCPAYHQSVVVRRSAHRLVPFAPDLPISADYGVIAGLISRGAACVRVDRALAVRRCGDGGLSERETRRRFVDFVRVQRQVLGLGRGRVGRNLARLASVHVALKLIRARPVATVLSRA